MHTHLHLRVCVSRCIHTEPDICAQITRKHAPTGAHVCTPAPARLRIQMALTHVCIHMNTPNTCTHTHTQEPTLRYFHTQAKARARLRRKDRDNTAESQVPVGPSCAVGVVGDWREAQHLECRPAWTENPHRLSQDPHALIMQPLGPGPSLRTFHTLAL